MDSSMPLLEKGKGEGEGKNELTQHRLEMGRENNVGRRLHGQKKIRATGHKKWMREAKIQSKMDPS